MAYKQRQSHGSCFRALPWDCLFISISYRNSKSSKLVVNSCSNRDLPRHFGVYVSGLKQCRGRPAVSLSYVITLHKRLLYQIFDSCVQFVLLPGCGVVELPGFLLTIRHCHFVELLWLLSCECSHSPQVSQNEFFEARPPDIVHCAVCGSALESSTLECVVLRFDFLTSVQI